MLLDNRCYLTLNMPSLWTLTRSSKGWQSDRHGIICLLLVVSVSLLNWLPLWQDCAEGNVRDQLLFTKVFSYQGFFPERLWWCSRLAWMGLKTTWPTRRFPAHASGVGTRWSFKVYSNPNLSMILQFCLNNFSLFCLNCPSVWNYIPDFHYHWILVLLPPLILCQSCQYFRFFFFPFRISLQHPDEQAPLCYPVNRASLNWVGWIGWEWWTGLLSLFYYYRAE